MSSSYIEPSKINERWNEMLRRQGIRRRDSTKKVGPRYACALKMDHNGNDHVIDDGLRLLLEATQRTSLAPANLSVDANLQFDDENTVLAFVYIEPPPASL